MERFLSFVLVAGLAAAGLYAYWPMPPAPDLSRQLALLHQHKQMREREARSLPPHKWAEGRTRYVELHARFNGLILAMESALRSGTASLDLESQLAEAVNASNNFESWYHDRPTLIGNGPSLSVSEVTGALKDLGEWSQQMRQKRRLATIQPLLNQLATLRWTPPEQIFQFHQRF